MFPSDYNFELASHGICTLVPGLEPISLKDWCKAHPDADEFFQPTGYRRLPLTTCEDGDQFDKMSTSIPCPGKEEEYEKKHRGPTGFLLFLVITVPFVIAGGAGWWVYRNWPAAGRTFGQIRLGEESSMLDEDRPWIRYPVIAVSAAVAVVATLPLVGAAVWRFGVGLVERWTGGGGGWRSGGRRTYATRDSFARGRTDYSIVDDDEGELLGEDSDEDVV